MNLNFAKTIESFIQDYHLIDKETKVIVGLSGGADSVALLTVLHELNYSVIAAHCNFHLRGDESIRDENFCRQLCSKMGVELIVRHFDVESHRNTHSESVEMACRTLRYDWWNGLIRNQVGDVIAVGHHRDDNIETFFLNLFRGSSLIGLKGLRPRNANVIRPLLDVSHRDILDYLRSRSLSFVTDSTNADNYFRRNRLRNVIIPLIEKEFPGAKKAIGVTIDNLRDNYNLYNDYCDILRNKYVKAGGEIDVTRLIIEERDPEMVLYELISAYGFNMSQIKDMLYSLSGGDKCAMSGKVFIGQSLTYTLNRGLLSPIDSYDIGRESDLQTISLFKHPFEMAEMNYQEFQSLLKNKKLKKNALYADSNILNGNPVFYMRSWQKGDRMKPFGLKGSKLLSDIFCDLKLSITQKANIKIILRDSDIIWIPGVRCSALFPVSDKTETVIEVTYNPENV